MEYVCDFVLCLLIGEVVCNKFVYFSGKIISVIYVLLFDGGWIGMYEDVILCEYVVVKIIYVVYYDELIGFVNCILFNVIFNDVLIIV